MKDAARHVPVVGGLTLVFGTLYLVGGLQAILRGLVEGPLAVLAGAIAILGVLGVVGGLGVLRHRAYGVLPTRILAGASLLAIPFGTAYGIYAFAVLRDPDAAAVLA